MVTDLEEESLESFGCDKATLKGQFWYLRSSKPVTLVQRVVALRTFENRLAGRFLFSGQEITRRKKELKKIFPIKGYKSMQQAIRMRIEADKAALDAGFTTNNFVGELGEKLAHAVYGGRILPNSAKSADIQTTTALTPG